MSDEEMIPLQKVIDVIQGVVVPRYAFEQETPHASLLVLQRILMDGIYSSDDWTSHYRFVPKHRLIVGNIERGIDDLPVSAKAKKLFKELVEESQRPERDTIYNRR